MWTLSLFLCSTLLFYCSWSLTYELSIAKMVIFPQDSWFIAGAIKRWKEINSALEILPHLPHYHCERQNYDCSLSPSLLQSFKQVLKSAKWNGTDTWTQAQFFVRDGEEQNLNRSLHWLTLLCNHAQSSWLWFTSLCYCTWRNLLSSPSLSHASPLWDNELDWGRTATCLQAKVSVK